MTRSVDTQPGCLSPQEQKTIDAIVRARLNFFLFALCSRPKFHIIPTYILHYCSELPLSIILVGVGDGPWDMMKEFDDNIPARVFDNFQVINNSAAIFYLFSCL